MKVVILRRPGGLDCLQTIERSDPGEPERGEIRVRIHASSLNYHDHAVVTGAIPTEDGRIPMSDGAGIVEAVGPGVEELAVGDAVVSTFFPTWLEGPPRIDDFSTTPGDGVDGYAREEVVRPAAAFTRAPEGWSHVEAATLTTAGLTAWRALIVDGGLKAGDTVLTLGTGGVSIFALQIAQRMGARVIATSSSEEKRERLRELGVEHVLDYESEPEWGARVKELTHGRGVDHVVEVGGAGSLPQSIEAVRTGGHIALIGILSGVSGDVPTVRMMAKQIRLQGLVVGSRAHQQDMVRGMEASGLRPIVDRSFALDELAEAFRYEEAGLHFGKIALEV